MRSQIAVLGCLLALAGCGGGGGGSSAPPPPAPAPSPPPAAPTPPPVIGMSGGSITETSGAKVSFPAGAVLDDTTFRIAIDSTGAPPLPPSLASVGSTYVITPHGGEFLQPVDVRIPAPSATLLPTQQLLLAKAQPDGQWEILADSHIVDGKLEASVGSFSYFSAVIVTYPLPIFEFEPLAISSTLDCAEQECSQALGPVTASYSVTTNNGQAPASCASPMLATSLPDGNVRNPVGNFTVTRTVQPSYRPVDMFSTYLVCPDYVISVGTQQAIAWSLGPSYPNLRIERIPDHLDVIEGLPANLPVIISGGAVRRGPGNALGSAPSATDRAIIDWQRSDDAGTSWRRVAQSFQDEADPLPFGTGLSWRPWQIQHGFIATAGDQGALMRVRACYQPASATSPICVTSTRTRLNVLQQSALPGIAEQPHSVLIRTAETATFSTSVSGTPAPTLQWQWRAANSTGEWTNVSDGAGATTSSYTTPPRLLPDNGTQYRVVATNALGTAASLPVTVSVSDLDVAPSITTQPAALAVSTGSDAVFAVTAYGTEALSYQWRLDGTPIAGANGAVLRLVGVTAASAGNYSVAVSNSAGSVISNAALLTVTAAAPVAVPPSIVTQPSAVTVNAGNTATLAVGVAGTGPFSFQWLRDGVAVNGATSAVLTFGSAALPNAGNYAVRVTNSAGQVVSDSAALDVIAAAAPVAPTIASQPATLIVPLDGSATLAVAANGTGPLAYQWYLDGNPLAGATLPVLTFSHLGSVDFGRYTVTVTNGVGTVTSQPADLILLGAPVITQQPAAATALEGAQATFFVQASGSGQRYQWSVNGTPIPGAIAATFVTPPLVLANTGALYSVMVYNAAGLVTSQGAVLTVQAVVAPSVTQQPANVTVQPGQTAQLCAAFGGTAPLDVSIQRWNGSSWVNVTGFPASGNDPVCHTTGALTLADDGTQFRFVAQNSAGLATSQAATVTVSSPSLTGTTLVSVELDGGEPDYFSGMPSLSADGRFVAFTSQGLNLVAGGTTNGSEQGHAYRRDLLTGTTILINQTIAGGVSSRGVANLRLSANGRYALFTSFANDLVAGDTNDSLDVFRRDLETGTTERVNVFPDGSQIEGAGNANFDARLAISGNGRLVTFLSSHDLAASGSGAANAGYYLYVRDMLTGTTRHVAGSPTEPVRDVAISENGWYIAYTLDLVAPAAATVWVYDTELEAYGPVYSFDQSVSPTGLRQGLGISADGQYLSFAINSPALTGSTFDQIVRLDRQDPSALVVVSSAGGNATGDGHSAWPQISGDGRHVQFESYAPNLTGGLGLPWRRYTVVRDLVAGTTRLASHALDGSPVDLSSNGFGAHALSGDGRVVAFTATQVYAEPRP